MPPASMKARVNRKSSAIRFRIRLMWERYPLSIRVSASGVKQTVCGAPVPIW
jgi:hypothetical protein